MNVSVLLLYFIFISFYGVIKMSSKYTIYCVYFKISFLYNPAIRYIWPTTLNIKTTLEVVPYIVQPLISLPLKLKGLFQTTGE